MTENILGELKKEKEDPESKIRNSNSTSSSSSSTSIREASGALSSPMLFREEEDEQERVDKHQYRNPELEQHHFTPHVDYRATCIHFLAWTISVAGWRAKKSIHEVSP
ncbi:Protein kinase domain-containing protein [Psidium guajava]|nr:Protein kinase domain-containing protein [Psidium guajava]